MKHLIEPSVHVLIEKDNKFLFLRRHNTGGSNGHWGLPAGKIDKGESPTVAAKREAMEEVGIKIDPILEVVVYSKIPNVLREYNADCEGVCFFFLCKEVNSEPINREVEKHDKMEWFSLDSLPAPIMPITRFGIECCLKKQPYGEFGYEVNVIE